MWKVLPRRNIEWFDVHGNPALVDHPLNTRSEEVSIEEYAESIEMNGLARSCRGEPWCQLSEGNQAPYRMITYRQLTKGFYLAYSRVDAKTKKNNSDDNKDKDKMKAVVAMSADVGLTNTRCLHWQTPPDVVEWLRDWHNNFHGGSKVSYVEVLQNIPRMLADWEVHARSERLTYRGCGDGDSSWDALRWSWLSTRADCIKTGVLTSRNAFDDGKSFVNSAKSLMWYDRFITLMKQTCVFHSPKLTVENCLFNLHDVTVALAPFSHTVPHDDLTIAFFEICLMVVLPLGSCFEESEAKLLERV